jgi:hypothetical protein
MNKLLITLTAIVFLTSCGKKKPAIYKNDTDSGEWINQKTVKDVPNAHSGASAGVIDSVNVFSLGLRKTIEDIGNDKLKEVEFSYWIYAKSDKAKVSTIFSADFNGQNIDWEGRPVIIKELNTWIEVHEKYKLPEKVKPNNQLTMYALNGSKEEILIDDLKFEFK